MVPGPPERLNKLKNRFFEKSENFKKLQKIIFFALERTWTWTWYRGAAFLLEASRPFTSYSLRVLGPMGPGPMGPGPKGQSAQRAHRPMAQGPSAHGPGPIGPKGPLGSPAETPLGSQGTPPGIPRDPLKSLFFKNRFFKKISVKLHQWVFYRTYP